MTELQAETGAQRREPVVFKVYEDNPANGWIFEVPTRITVERSWYERWLSLPWKPWIKTKTVRNPMVPRNGQIWKTDQGWFCNPKTAIKLRRSFQEGKEIASETTNQIVRSMQEQLKFSFRY